MQLILETWWYIYVVCKVNISNVKGAEATTFIFNLRTNVLQIVMKFLRQRNVSTQEGLEPPTFGFMPNGQTIGATMAIHLLTHWGQVTHLCVNKLTSIASDNGLPPERRQAIIWNSAGILLIGPLGTNFSEILIKIHTFSFKKMHLKMSSANWRLSFLSLKELTHVLDYWLWWHRYFVHIWNVNSAPATALIYDSWTNVVKKLSKYFRKMLNLGRTDSRRIV